MELKLSLSAFLNDTERHSKHLAVTDVIQKLATELKRYDGRLDNISHKRYRELFESINRNGDVLQICKDTYTSQVKSVSRYLFYLVRYLPELSKLYNILK